MERRRATVRIVCLDCDERVLLGAWQDRVAGDVLWELPGGGIEAGESALEAARRELLEETGLELEPEATGFQAWRDVWWLGVHYVGFEPFFLLRDLDPNAISTARFLSDERDTFIEYRWLDPEQLSELHGRLENPDLATIVARLAADSRWRDSN